VQADDRDEVPFVQKQFADITDLVVCDIDNQCHPVRPNDIFKNSIAFVFKI
jgi:hypothetical protein